MIFPGVCFVAFSPTRSSVCALPRVKRCGDGAWGLPVAVFVSLQLHPPRACRRPQFFTQHSLSEDEEGRLVSWRGSLCMAHWLACQRGRDVFSTSCVRGVATVACPAASSLSRFLRGARPGGVARAHAYAPPPHAVRSTLGAAASTLLSFPAAFRRPHFTTQNVEFTDSLLEPRLTPLQTRRSDIFFGETRRASPGPALSSAVTQLTVAHPPFRPPQPTRKVFS